MNRVIHGAIRRDLARFLDALDQFPEGDHRRAEQLGTAWDNFVQQLTHHHYGEHEIVWPVLEDLGVDRGLLAQMDVEHDRLADALGSAGQAMDALRTTRSASAAAAARVAMDVLRTVAEEHLAHEEAELEPFYAANHKHQSVKAMSRRLARNSPSVAGAFFAWITDRASPEELAAVKRHVPAPVLVIFCGLFGSRYRREVASVWR